MSIEQERTLALNTVIERVRRLTNATTISRAILDQIATELKQLGARAELFPVEDFPSPVKGEKAGTRYMLHKESEEGFSLYLISINPGKNTIPHTHSTWAVIVGIEGNELNRLYRRVDDGADATRAQLELEQEIMVGPDEGYVALLDNDIHSVHVEGENSIRHFHLYGRPIEALSERLGFDLGTGEVVAYNKTHLDRREVDARR